MSLLYNDTPIHNYYYKRAENADHQSSCQYVVMFEKLDHEPDVFGKELFRISINRLNPTLALIFKSSGRVVKAGYT